MKPLYDSVLVAEFLRAKGFENHCEIKKSLLHKLLYYIYGLHLAEFEYPLLNEQPKAWPSGPVFPKIEKSTSINCFHSVTDPRFEELRKDQWLVMWIQETIALVRKHSEDDFSWWLRNDRGPWRKATSKVDFMWNDTINDGDIKSYFSTFYSKTA